MGIFNDIASAVGDVTSSIGDIISPISGLISGGMNYLGTSAQNQQSAANLATSNQFAADQFASRYQTTVKDLQAAGLNPMLAYSQGGGSPPSSAGVAPVQNKLAAGVNSAVNAASTVQNVLNQQSQREQVYSNIDLQHAQMLDTLSHVPVNDQNREVLRSTVAKIAQDINESISRSALNTANRALSVADLPTYQARGDYYKKYGLSPEKFTQMGGQIISSASQAFNAGKRKGPMNYQPTINNYEAQ